jgi:hypothetical protein
MIKVLTFSQWLSQECSLTEEQLRVVSLEYGEDAKDYIESKQHEYNIYLQNH